LMSLPKLLLDDESAKEVHASLMPFLETVAKAFSHAVECKALNAGDGAVRTHILWVTVHGLDHLQKRDVRNPELLHVKNLERHMLQTLFKGWGASAENVDALTL